MSLSLYEVVIPPFQQILTSVAALLDKAEAWCGENGIAPEDIIQARLANDMLPFAYQVKSTAVHSLGAIEGVRRGTFSPDMEPPPETFSDLSKRIADTRGGLSAIDPEEMNGFAGRPMRFSVRGHYADYTAESFLLTFSKPNFYFHATTAYDILRWKGLAVGKVDYLGRLNMVRES
jgi:hypothetical protein